MRALRSKIYRRGYRATLIGVVLLAGGAPAAPMTSAAPATPFAAGVWQLRWSPAANTTGLSAFEGVEEDRANSHPAGQPHILVQGNNYRINMHTVDRDTMTDRQRQEVKGMMANGQEVVMLKGEVWRFTQSMYIPGSLKATTTFTHIMQMKMPGTGSLPILTVSLRRIDGAPKIRLEAQGGVVVGSANLTGLQDRWIDLELQMTIGDTAAGELRWILRNGSTTVIDVVRVNVDTWLGDRVRPKWGIYRSLGDTSGSLANCYLLLTNLRAYKWSTAAAPSP